MKLKALTLAVLLGVSTAEARCVLTWDPSTTFTDGKPLQASVKYQLYFQAKDTSVVRKLAETMETTVTLEACPPGEYWVTASIESTKSNLLTLPSTPPAGVRPSQ